MTHFLEQNPFFLWLNLSRRDAPKQVVPLKPWQLEGISIVSRTQIRGPAREHLDPQGIQAWRTMQFSGGIYGELQ